MASHVNFEDIERYIRDRVYPSEIGAGKGKKANFRKACISFPKGEYFQAKGVLISQAKSNPGSTYKLGQKYWGVLLAQEISTGEYFQAGVLLGCYTGMDFFLKNEAWKLKCALVVPLYSI